MLSPPCWQAFLVLWFAGTDCWSQEFCSDGTLLHEDVCLPRSYSRINLPTYNLLEISADFGVRAIREVNDFEMTVTLDMEMSFEWQEPRLQVDPEGAGSLAEGMESLDFEMSFPLLWKPDFYIKDLIAYEQKKVLGPVAGLILHGNNTVILWIEAMVTIACAMKFEDFPFDEQTCDFSVGSSSHPSDKVILTTHMDFEHAGRHLQMFKVSAKNLDESKLIHIDENSGYNYSIAGFTVDFSRHSKSFVFKYYLPSCSMVVISWISFLIPPTAIPGRVALLVTIFLVLTTYFSDIETHTPKSNNLTALSSYLLVCILFSFGATIEFAINLFIKRNQDNLFRKQEKLQKQNTGEKENKAQSNKWRLDKEEEWSKRNKILEEADQICFHMDRASLVGFAFTFIVYNIVYVILHS